MTASAAKAPEPSAVIDRSVVTCAEEWTDLPETEQRERVAELIVAMRELGFGPEDLADEPHHGYVRFNTVSCAAYLLQEAAGGEERRYWFQWDPGKGPVTTDVATVFYVDDSAEIEAAWERPIEWTDERVEALDQVKELLDPPEHFPGRRTDWLTLVATVHMLNPNFNVYSNRLDLTNPDSRRTPLWDMVKGNACRVDPQELVDIAYGRLIRANLGSEYWRTNYDDPRYDTFVRRALRTYPGGDADLDGHIGKVVRKAAYNEGKYTTSPA